MIETARPTGTVVGRKRKPDADDVEVASEAADELASEPADQLLYAHNKRMRLLDRLSVPFRGFNTNRAADVSYSIIGCTKKYIILVGNNILFEKKRYL